MIEELRKAMNKAEELSATEQKYIAELILSEIESDRSLQASPEKITMLANEALTEYKAGKTKPMDF
jgi:hypothetical protein